MNMKKRTLIVIFSIFLVFNSFSQITSKSSLINYFDSAQSLDPIEGLWSLNVVRTLYYFDDIIGQETEEVRSDWGIKRFDKLKFKVINIGEGSNEDKGDFNAFFESSAIDGFYTYKVNFSNPNWYAKANAELTNGFILEYGYFVDEVYMKTAYKKYYRQGLKLHWKFIWIKKYPKLNTSKNIEKNNTAKEQIIQNSDSKINTLNDRVVEATNGLKTTLSNNFEEQSNRTKTAFDNLNILVEKQINQTTERIDKQDKEITTLKILLFVAIGIIIIGIVLNFVLK